MKYVNITMILMCLTNCLVAQNSIEVEGDTIKLESPDGTKTIMMRTEGASGELKSIGDLYLRGQNSNVLINHVASDGNVGIGTNAPIEKLQVIGGINIGNTSGTHNGTIRFTGSDFEGHINGIWQSLSSLIWNQNGTDVFYSGGDVGIGTLNPTSRFEVVDDNTSGETADITTSGALAQNADVLNLGMNSASSPLSQFVECRLGSSQVFAINGNGSVKVGTIAIPTGFMMAVDGNAIFEEVHVELSNNWPDYVFKDNYKLMPISELKTFIDKYGHLPNIPRADKIESSSLAIGEMQRLLMEKIEELTLYVIQLSEENRELRNIIKK